MGNIDERAIGNLSLAAELTKNIEMKIAEGKDKREALAAMTPKFVWILKDFTLELKDAQGKDITANDYLEDSLSTTQLVLYKKIIKIMHSKRKVVQLKVL